MRVTLIDNLVFPVGRQLDDFDVHPNLGLASLATTIRDAGHAVDIVDPKREVRSRRWPLGADLHRVAADALLAPRPDALGFTTLGCSFIFTVRVAEEVRRREPDLPILLGGPHATVLDRAIMEAFDPFDVIVRHEADETIAPVLDGLESRSFGGIPGVTFRTGRTMLGIRSNPGAPKVDDLDRLPFPAYDLTPIEDLDLPYLRLEAGRGCPWACTFCSTASFFQRSYRLKSAARLVADLDRLHARYGHSTFKLEHDLFTVKKREVAAFCAEVRDRNYLWMASARIDCVDDDLLEQMADAGCRELYFGVETGSPSLQRSLHKRLDLDLLEPVLRRCAEVGIEAVTSFITGFPDETRDDQNRTLDTIGTLLTTHRPAPTTQLHLLLPEPGTGEFEQHEAELTYDGYVAEFNAEPHRGDADLIRAHRQIFATYHFYPALLARADHIAVVELTRELVGLGPVVLRALLGDASLAELVASIRARRPAGDGVDDSGDDPIVDEAVARWGPGHYVTSLVRLRRGLAATDAPHRSSPPPTTTGAPALVLAPSATLFRDLHDCASILTHLTNRPDEPLDEDTQARTNDYLAVRTTGGVQLFEIDPLTHLVASEFRRPTDPLEVAARLRSALGTAVPLDPVVERLLRADALVAG